MSPPLQQLIKIHRAKLATHGTAVRIVYHTELIRKNAAISLDAYIAERAPAIYRPIAKAVNDLRHGFYLNTFKETLARIPTAETFQSSHFGEIAACLFAEEVLGLKKLYNKLSLLTAENSNAFKMDLLLYDDTKSAIEFVFGEVKSSAKSVADGDPPRHDVSCYPSLFKSLREYTDADQEFDLAAIKDRLDQSDDKVRAAILTALQPYGTKSIRYAGFVTIDSATRRDKETGVLLTRASPKKFDVDLICIEDYSAVAVSVFNRLNDILSALRRACSP